MRLNLYIYIYIYYFHFISPKISKKYEFSESVNFNSKFLFFEILN